MSEELSAEPDATDEDDGFSLTTEQQSALTLLYNLAITAGAGTGKTTTLKERYRHILAEKPDIDPENILTLTFTKDAAGEMREQIRDVIDEELAAADTGEYDRWRAAKDGLEDAYIHTIHAFCSRLLREFAVEAGVHPDFETLDEGDADQVINDAITAVLDRHGVEDGLYDRAGRLARDTDASDTATSDDRAWDPHEELQVLTQLYSRSNLRSALASLFDERPDSVEWADRWADQTPADYQEYCTAFVDVSIALDEADDLIETPQAQDAIQTLLRLADMDIDVSSDDSGKALLDDLAAFLADTGAHRADGDTVDRQRFLLKVAQGVTSGSGSRYSRSHYYGGAKSNWDSSGYEAERKALTDALDELADVIEPEDRNLDHDPAVERNGARQAIALARVFQITRDEYARYKQRRNALDYSNLITDAITFLEDNETARRTLRDQFEYIMVDEVQDTDPRQWQLVKLLSGDDPDRFDGQNVFLVGDEKQSIYRFRDADVTQFRRARGTLLADNPADADGDRELSGNFRTVNPTLTVINELFAEILQPAAIADDDIDEPEDAEYEPYEAEPQRLTCERDEGNDVDGSVEYLLVPDDEDADDALGLTNSWYTDTEFLSSAEREADAIAARLTQLFAEDTEVYDPDAEEYTTAQPKHVALLFRSSRRLDAFERALDAHDIPYTNLAGSGFYDTPEIRPLLNLLKVLEDPHATTPLYGVLRSPIFGFTDEDLTAAYDPDDTLWDGLADATPALQAARDTIATWRAQAGLDDADRVHQWSTLISTIIDDTGYLISVGADDRPQQAVANVEKFRQQLRTWEEGSAQSITAIIDRIERARDTDDDPSEATIPGDIDGVQLRTIHSAKGLEFPIVGIPELTRQFNHQSPIPKAHFEHVHDDPVLGLKAPTVDNPYDHTKTATYLAVREHYRARERAEQRRLLYVAATRTRDHLILTGTHSTDPDTDTGLPKPGDWDDADSWNDWLQPTLLDEPNLPTRLETDGSITATLGDAPYTIRRPTPPADWTPASSDDTIPTDIEIPAPDRADAKQRLTATQFRDLLSDAAPTPDLLSETDSDIRDAGRTTGPTGNAIEADTIGSIVHKLCELDPDRSQWPAIIRRLVDDPEELSDAAIQNIMDQADIGRDALSGLEADATVTSRHSELSVTLDLDAATVTGDIDHLTVTDDSYVITDFKTSTVTPETIADKTEHYYLQLLAYAAALAQADGDREHIRIAVVYTEVEETRVRTLSREDIASLQEWANTILESEATTEP